MPIAFEKIKNISIQAGILISNGCVMRVIGSLSRGNLIRHGSFRLTGVSGHYGATCGPHTWCFYMQTNAQYLLTLAAHSTSPSGVISYSTDEVGDHLGALTTVNCYRDIGRSLFFEDHEPKADPPYDVIRPTSSRIEMLIKSNRACSHGCYFVEMKSRSHIDRGVPPSSSSSSFQLMDESRI